MNARFPWLDRPYFLFSKMLKALLEKLKLSDEALRQLTKAMRTEMDRGLSTATTDEAEIKMLPTYVTGTPNGTGMFRYVRWCIIVALSYLLKCP